MNKYTSENRLMLINLFINEMFLNKTKNVTSTWLSEATKELKQRSLHLSSAQVGQFIRQNMVNTNIEGFTVLSDGGYHYLEELN